jgi:4-aminobutyrate aminotransferase
MSQERIFENVSTWLPYSIMPSQVEDWPLLPVVKAEGAYLYTVDGRKILDFTSGIAVTNCGHGHPKILKAAHDQMNLFSHSAVGITLHEPLMKLTEELAKVTPGGMDMFFFGNSGAEAVEGALKLARYVTNRPGIIAFEGGFHGRTMGAASVTSAKSKYRKHYEPFLPSVYFSKYAYPYRCPLGNSDDVVSKWALDDLQKVFDRYIQPNEVGAIIIEPIQGEGGYIVPPKDFLHSIRKICDQHGIMLIFDEVQSGFGRTGQMFASQAFEVVPDIMAVAKGIANGFPLSATIAKKELMQQWLPGSHGTTFGGNPIACAAAVATLEVIKEENLLENTREMGLRLKEGLINLKSRFDFIGDVRGIGLMVAMEIVKPGTKDPDGTLAMKILQKALDRDVLVYMAGLYGQVVRFMPPLNVTLNQINQCLEVIGESLKFA